MSHFIKSTKDLTKSGLTGIPMKPKDVVSGIKKIYKTVTKSTVGRLVLMAVAIYFGGAAFGMWNSGFAGVDGAFVGGAAAAEGGAATAALEAPAAAAATELPASAATGALEGAGATTAGDTAAELTAASGGAGAAPAAAGTPGAFAPLDSAAYTGTSAALTTPGGMSVNAGGGLIGNAANGASWFSQMSPLAQYGAVQAGAGAVQSAFTPNALDVEAERAKQERENLEWRNNFLSKNFNVANVNVGQASGDVLRDQNGNPVYPAPGQPVSPRGLIQTAMTPRQLVQ